MNANQLFKWRRAFERGELSESNVALIPVRVNTHPATILRRLETCNPLRFAAIVPATPELSTLVVLTGSPANFPDYWFTRFRPMPTAGTTLH
jgi:transposase-like protein